VEDAVMNDVMVDLSEGVKVLGKKGIGFA